jgi:hypothetical protein
MPLKLSAGISKKMGLPNYGSLGAMCHVEVELDAGLLAYDLDGLNQHIHNAYVACSQAVNDELARHREATENGYEQVAPAHTVAAEHDAHESAVDQTGSNGNGRRPENGDTPQAATARQIEYIRVLASQIRGIGVRRLDTVTETLCGKPLADLSNAEASALIDVLKNVRVGKLDLETALSGVAE